MAAGPGSSWEGATSTIQQTQIDAEFNLAFKRSIAWSEEYSADTVQQEAERYKAIIYELIALELLSGHPNVIDLLGITWETDSETEQIWPVLLTERSIHGSMADFLRSDSGAQLDYQKKLSLCGDVARACLAMHTLGIVHGDIKQENILLFGSRGSWTGKLIDFGFSCLGTSDHDMVQVACTRPWQAPEHKQAVYFQLESARRMDVYSFGMLLCRTLLSDELHDSIGMLANCNDPKEHLNLVEMIESLKSSPQFLNLVLEALERSAFVEKPAKHVLRRIFEMTLQHDPRLRAPDFFSITSLISTETLLNSPATTDFGIINSLPHVVLDIGKLLADLDDTDYVLHRTIVGDLERRAAKFPHCPCFNSAASQLWLCYEVGFGVSRNTERSAQWLGKSLLSTADSSDLLVKIDEEYEAKPPYRLLKKLGYEMNLAFDPVEVYRVQNRMCEAEKALRKEVIGRQQSMGPQSKGYISQLSTLALLLSVAGNLEEAEQAACSAADSSREAYGDESDETISALNYLAKILYKREKWVALETLQHKLIPIKLSREDIGPTDTTTLNSQNYLVVAYCFQGQYDKSIELAQKLIAFRKEHLGEEHTETLVTTNWLCRALLEKGEFEGLETRVRKLVGASERVCGKTDDATVERKELLASILLSQADPNRVQFNSKGLEEARQLVCEVLDEIDKQNGNQNLVLFLRAQTTLICILAIESRFEDANHEIENAAPNLECFKDAVGEHNVELQSFKRVVDYVRALQELQHDAREESVSEADAIRGKLARRW